MLGCLEWLFTIAEFAIYGVVALGLVAVMAGVAGAFGAVSYSEATVSQQAGQGCVVGFFVGLAIVIVAVKARKG